MTNADRCRAKMETGECPGHLYYTVPKRIARCRRSRVWVEDMEACKLGLWKAEPKAEPVKTKGRAKRGCNDADQMAYYLEDRHEAAEATT